MHLASEPYQVGDGNSIPIAPDGNNRLTERCACVYVCVVTLPPSLASHPWPFQKKYGRQCFNLGVYLTVYCPVCVFVFARSGGIRRRNSFGSGFWGPNGADGRHSGQALPTDPVALHWAPVDHRPLPLTELALPVRVSVHVDGPLLLHTTHSPLQRPHCTLTPKGRQVSTETTSTYTIETNERGRTQMATRDGEEHIEWLRSIPLFSLTHSTQILFYSCFYLTQDVVDVII